MRRLLFLPVILLILLLGSCRPSVPREFIQPKAMENILYDYHIALGMAQEQYPVDSERRVHEQAYKLVVLAKHGVTEEEFEKSLEYYMRHTKELHDIYERLTERLENEAVAQGVSEGEINLLGANVEQGDTANVWNGDRALVLMRQAPYNSYSFTIKADTSFHKGDRLTMTFNTQYLVQDGSRDAVIVLAMRLANDSIVTQYQHMMTNSRQTISLSDTKRLGIKEIKGYFMLAPDLDKTTTLKLLFLSNIKMTRIHEAAPKVTDAEKQEEGDSVEAKTMPDSVVKGNMPMRKRPPLHEAVPVNEAKPVHEPVREAKPIHEAVREARPIREAKPIMREANPMRKARPVSELKTEKIKP